MTEDPWAEGAEACAEQIRQAVDDEILNQIIECAKALDAMECGSTVAYLPLHKVWLRPRPRSRKRRIQKKWFSDPWKRC